jgi:nucleoside-diphosphate-sugar epimerase
MDDHVAVIGGTGYLGGVLVAALLRAGFKVTIVARRTPTVVMSGAEFAASDASVGPSLSHALRGITNIVNAMSGTPSAIVRVALNLGAHVRRAQIAGTPIRLVHISSLAVFGQTSGMLGEATPTAPAKGHAYATAKSEAEKILLADLPTHDCCTILRPGCLYGPCAPIWSDRIGRLLLDGRLGALGAEGRGWCSAVHVGDLANAVLTALRAGRGASGVHHILSPDEMTWNDYLCRFGAHLGLVSVPMIGRGRLATESWIRAPVGRLQANLGRPPVDILTPSMRRVFRSRALPLCHRPALLPPHAYCPIDEGLAEAARSLLQRDKGRSLRQRGIAYSWARAL